ncbi:hypothetical protein KK062_23530 [Fulvivirgaceae bacterium PWU5]|uniref:Uncharacterized protein n=1 Tax=Dawidia cretensis TaxID=2782350 RepID=A0AAP2GS21_9BACT|nr:hypothetical protein [Dawidia cretensis]
MCDKITNHLRNKDYKYHCEHVSFEGGHYVMKKHFDKVFEFAEKHHPIGP